MTSEVKGYFYKVVDNPLEFMHPKFCTDILTSCLVTWDSTIYMKLNISKVKSFNNIFVDFMTSEVKGHERWKLIFVIYESWIKAIQIFKGNTAGQYSKN